MMTRVDTPNLFELQSSRITKTPNGTLPFDSSTSEIMRDCCRIYKLPFATPGYLCFSWPATTSFRDALLESSVLLCVQPCTCGTSASLLLQSRVSICILRPRAWSLLRYATSAGQTHRDYDRTLPRPPGFLEEHDRTSSL